MDLEKAIDKLILGNKTLDEKLGKIPELDETVQRYTEGLFSKHPLRTLGVGLDSDIFLSEELRAAHIHILGTTRKGKSKFVELLIRHDIDNGYGATLLDPSDNGQTAYDIFRYCISKGFTKVCLIDPHDNRSYIPTINPLKWRGAAATDSVVASLMEATRLLWGQTDFSTTTRIETYLDAIFTALYATGNPHYEYPYKSGQYLKPLNCGIPDAVCFLTNKNPHYAQQREDILQFLHPWNDSRAVLEDVFKNPSRFEREFLPSIRRLSPFFKYLPARIFGSAISPIDFRKMVSEKWIILVNLDDARLWGTAQQRLLGTVIVNEIISAVQDLTANDWKGRHYLYIDEAGYFATRALAKIMALKGKSGLWATVSHQFYGQFEDKFIMDAIENLCGIKVLFNTRNSVDRNRMIRDMYTGALRDQASDAFIALKKQHAVIKIGEEPPVSLRIADVPTVNISKIQFDEFKTNIYTSNSWYRTQAQIQEEINNRFAIQPDTAAAADPDNTVKPKTSARPQPAGKDKLRRATGKQNAEPNQQEDTSGSDGSEVFDSLANSAALLRDKKGRQRTGKPKAPPKGE